MENRIILRPAHDSLDRPYYDHNTSNRIVGRGMYER